MGGGGGWLLGSCIGEIFKLFMVLKTWVELTPPRPGQLEGEGGKSSKLKNFASVYRRQIIITGLSGGGRQLYANLVSNQGIVSRDWGWLTKIAFNWPKKFTVYAWYSFFRFTVVLILTLAAWENRDILFRLVHIVFGVPWPHYFQSLQTLYRAPYQQGKQANTVSRSRNFSFLQKNVKQILKFAWQVR